MNSSAFELPISDHKLITFNIHLPAAKTSAPRSISFRNIKNINYSSDFCNNFMSFFLAKIENIHHQLPSSCNTEDCHLCSFSPALLTCPLSNFELPAINEISSLIHKAKTSTCHLDPLPTSLVKAYLPFPSPLITSIVHSFILS